MTEATRIKNKIIETNTRGLALDIDGTLAWTVKIWSEQLLVKFGNPENLTVEEIISKYHFTSNVPYWQTPNVKEYLHQVMNSNKIQESMPLIKDSNQIVGKINQIIPIKVYLTVRPETVLEGTKYWLNKHKFPKTDVISRPVNIDFSQSSRWKAEMLSSLFPNIIGMIDDNPNFIKYLPANYPGIIYLYNYENYSYQKIKIIPCKNWSSVLKNLQA